MKFTKTILGAIAAAALIGAQTASAAISYSEDWEDRTVASGAGVGDGWVIGNTDYTAGGSWFVGFAAPTGVGAWADFVNEGGAGQGDVQLSAYTDYNNGAYATNDIEGFLYKDLGLITADMVGTTYIYSYDAKRGNVDDTAASFVSAEAYLNVLKQSDGSFGEIFNQSNSYAGIPADGSWGGDSILLQVTADMVGELLQVGFSHRCNTYCDSGMFYDNLNFAPIPVPAAAWLFGSGLIGLVGVARRRRNKA